VKTDKKVVILPFYSQFYHYLFEKGGQGVLSVLCRKKQEVASIHYVIWEIDDSYLLSSSTYHHTILKFSGLLKIWIYKNE